MISPYTVPVLTPEEIRSGMPSLTSRQFWMAAANIDIDKDVIIAAIKAEVPDGVDRKMMIAELESGSFERLNPTIIDVMNLMDIPAYQVDSLCCGRRLYNSLIISSTCPARRMHHCYFTMP